VKWLTTLTLVWSFGLCLLAGSSWAASIFTGVTWDPITVGGHTAYMTDPVGDRNPGNVDMVGNATYPLLYWAVNDNGTPTNASDDYLLFRMRMEVDIVNSANPGCYQICFDTNGDNNIEWVFQYDAKTDLQVELSKTIVGGPLWKNINISVSSYPWTGSIATYFEQVYPTGDGSSFAGTSDSFLDIGIPMVDFCRILYNGAGPLPFRVAMTTSQDHNNTNKDTPSTSTQSDPVGPYLSDELFPEPSTWALFGVGFLGLIWWRKRTA
jgi:hypothetical protein